MSISLIEGLILLSVAGMGGIVWWGVLRLVAMNDATLLTLQGIQSHLSLINGRLGKTDTWMEMHQVQDDRQFSHIQESMTKIWNKLDSPR